MKDRQTIWADIMRERGHTPSMDPDDTLNIFFHDNYTHNGPGCTACGWQCCWHCEDDAEKAIPYGCEKRK